MKISIPSSSAADGQRAFETDWQALARAFLQHSQATPACLAKVIDDHPQSPMGPLAKGYMLLMLARRELLPGAAEALAEARRRMTGLSDARAAAYADGLEAWLAGDPRGAISAMERVIGGHPLDAMAIKFSHAIRFMGGDADGMRRSLARVVSIYGDGVPHAGFIKGCYAFALEETGALAEAERMGRKAVELEPTDAWARHAVAHTFEMTGRAKEGLAWMADGAGWSHCNNFGFHMHWHVALFHLELGHAAEALRLYDSAVRSVPTDDFRDIANAASLLQRLELDGLSVGDRWDELAVIAERRVDDRQLAFADLHYLIALLGAGRFASAETLVRGLIERGPAGSQTDAAAAIGAPVAAGIVAFRAGRMSEAVAFLEPVRSRLQALGGSHAQRDVFEQIYLEALVRSDADQAASTLEGRLAGRGGRNGFAMRRLQTALAGSRRAGAVVAALALTPSAHTH